MSYVIKNEEILIEKNVRVHAKLGVDCFIVMDNGSTDKTVEIIKKLQKEFSIMLIKNPINRYRQSDWHTAMAWIAKNDLKADWIIANDADEFWLPISGNIKNSLSRWKSVIDCERFDMQLTESTINGKFYDRIYRTFNSINYRKNKLLDEENISINLSPIHGKVINNLHGLIRSKSGNHRSWHWWAFINKQASPDIKVYHYPLTNSFEKFSKKVINRKKLLDEGVYRGGSHFRRWIKMYENNTLSEEWERLCLDEKSIEILLKYGVIIEDQFAKKTILKLLFE